MASPSALEALVSDVVGPFFDSVAPSAASVCPSLAATSVCLTTNSTVTATSGTPLRSVYMLQNPVPSLSVQAPVPTTPATPVRDEPPPVSPGTLHTPPQAPTETFQNYQPPSPAASATLFYRSADIQGSVPPVTVVCPDSSSSQIDTAPTSQAYTTFESLFPVHQFSNLSNMPTSILIHYLVHSFIWATSVLRGMIREHPVNYLVDPADQAGRAILMPTPLWPGGEHTLMLPLDELLMEMIPIYARLLTRDSFTY